ncbi:hypothetical protein [Runella sp. SP2]|uniref:hypothetical protein n=1 Tax=Runella sp. SP2 TaxID=2268026 RepID=UPI000F08DA90|nr:hypothetical protein [Runella sp. SP2]AYQ31028.1 hypothetical protein DTQ70_02025 [Runella sp. SP2]
MDSNIHSQIEHLINNEYNKHPFTAGIDKANVEGVLAEYLGLCLCAPYIIGGSSNELFLNCVFSGRPIDRKIEITTAVAAFLSFDETGNYNKVIAGGHEALLSLLDTSDFHSNMLRRDLKLLFGKDISPTHNSYLKYYFVQLSKGLSNIDDVQRCAALVALEVHSEIMILSLWDSVMQVFPEIERNKLEYFYLHVGGDNPAEKYHVAMTEQMINEVVGQDNLVTFFTHFKFYYEMNTKLCRDILDNNAFKT